MFTTKSEDLSLSRKFTFAYAFAPLFWEVILAYAAEVLMIVLIVLILYNIGHTPAYQSPAVSIERRHNEHRAHCAHSTAVLYQPPTEVVVNKSFDAIRRPKSVGIPYH